MPKNISHGLYGGQGSGGPENVIFLYFVYQNICERKFTNFFGKKIIVLSMAMGRGVPTKTSQEFLGMGFLKIF